MVVSPPGSMNLKGWQPLLEGWQYSVWPELQSRYYYYHHIQLFWFHSPGCDREKTAPSSWPSIVKRCGRDTVVRIFYANNIDGHLIRKIVAKAFIYQILWGPITWHADKRPLLWWTGVLTMTLHIQSDKVKTNYVLLTHGWNDDKALVIAPPCDDNMPLSIKIYASYCFSVSCFYNPYM